jgi:hypothetical protein
LKCNSLECTFAHPGSQLIKIGHISRCPSLPRFGNKDTLYDDLKKIKPNDIRTLMFYAFTDLFNVSLWTSQNPKELHIPFLFSPFDDYYSDSDEEKYIGVDNKEETVIVADLNICDPAQYWDRSIK